MFTASNVLKASHTPGCVMNSRKRANEIQFLSRLCAFNFSNNKRFSCSVLFFYIFIFLYPKKTILMSRNLKQKNGKLKKLLIEVNCVKISIGHGKFFSELVNYFHLKNRQLKVRCSFFNYINFIIQR
jgi:hypothetical protein